MDHVAEFFEDRCIFDLGAFLPYGALRFEYEDWARRSGHGPLPKNAFTDRLKDAGCENTREYVNGKQAHVWRGIGLKPIEVALSGS